MEYANTAVLADCETARILTPVPDAGGVAVVELHGDIDLAVVEPMRDVVVSGVVRNRDVLVDLADVNLIDAASLGVLVQGDQLAVRRGHRVCLAAPSLLVRRILAGAGLDRAFPMFHSRADALRELSSNACLAA